jgi:hypothetical protein
MIQLSDFEIDAVSGGMGGRAPDRSKVVTDPRNDAIMGGFIGGGIAGSAGGLVGLVLGAIGGAIGGAIATPRPPVMQK